MSIEKEINVIKNKVEEIESDVPTIEYVEEEFEKINNRLYDIEETINLINICFDLDKLSDEKIKEKRKLHKLRKSRL